MEVVAQQDLWLVLDQWDPEQVESGQVKHYQLNVLERLGEFTDVLSLQLLRPHGPV